MRAVVDASVVLAWMQDEPGADDAEPMLMEGVIGAANWSEVLQKARQHGAPVEMVGRLLASFGLSVVAVTADDAERAANLWSSGSALSLGDRLCLALGLRLNLAVATADAGWADVDGGPRLVVIRSRESRSIGGNARPTIIEWTAGMRSPTRSRSWPSGAKPSSTSVATGRD